jgi:hypothetical protein
MIPDHCFEDIKRSFNNMVHTSFIAYDRDDKDDKNKFENLNSSKLSDSLSFRNVEDIFFDNKYHGINEWVDIVEPVFTSNNF